MQAILLAVHIPAAPKRSAEMHLIAVGDARRTKPNPQFDLDTESVLGSLGVHRASAQLHDAGLDGVQLWTYRLGPAKNLSRSALFVLIGESGAVGRLLYRRLSCDQHEPEHWVNAAA